MPRQRLVPVFFGIFAVIALLIPSTHATWSIILANSRTKEIVLGSVTCLANTYDLKAYTPVLLPQIGAACSQAYLDSDASRRQTIQRGLLGGIPLDSILKQLESLPEHDRRQYGMLYANGREPPLAFTGTRASPSAGHFVGSLKGRNGHISYSVQGNILAGDCILESVVDTIHSEALEKDLPDLLASAMEAAHAMGGDGRCSCPVSGNATACGCPVSSFEKSGHIGYLLGSREGDTVDSTCDPMGCARGDYYLDINIAFQSTTDTDPTIQLLSKYKNWRDSLLTVPDAITSHVTISAAKASPSGKSTVYLMHVQLRDWTGAPSPVDSIRVEHTDDSARVARIQPPRMVEPSLYEVVLYVSHPRMMKQTDEFRVAAQTETRGVVVLAPFVSVTYPA